MEYRTYDTIVVPEVEGVVVFPPLTSGPTKSEQASAGGMRWRLQHIKESGLGRLHDVQRAISKQSSGSVQKLRDMTRTASGHANVMRARGVERWRDMQRTVSDRKTSIQSTLHRKIEELKPAVREQVTRLSSDMHSNAPKWAGIAAGAGLALGIGGRILRHRMHHHDHEHIPTLVIVEATC